MVITENPYGLRKFLLERYFIPHSLNPFEFFNDDRENAIIFIIQILNKLDNKIRANKQNIIDAFCLDCQNPILATNIYDKLFVPFGFNPTKIQALTIHNRMIVVDFLQQYALKHNFLISVIDILDTAGIKKH